MRRATAIRIAATGVGAVLLMACTGAGCDFSCKAKSEPPTAAEKVNDIVNDAVRDAKRTDSDVKITVKEKPD